MCFLICAKLQFQLSKHRREKFCDKNFISSIRINFGFLFFNQRIVHFFKQFEISFIAANHIEFDLCS